VAVTVESTGSAPDGRSIALVIGPGRSGTSTIAGALAKSGLEVPGRVIRGNVTNPSGFFEPRWVVDFHRRLLKSTGVRTLDVSPHSQARVDRLLADPKVHAELRSWLAKRLESQPRLVVKDPRTVWFARLWNDVACELDADLGFITMLRHPAEVSASRKKYYHATESPRRSLRSDLLTGVAGWVNVALNAEALSQGGRRAFVSYSELTADWRTAMGRVGSSLRIGFEPPLSDPEHPVDEFIDPSLHRVQDDWTEVDVAAPLRDLADRLWAALSRLVTEDDEQGRRQVQALRDEYALMYDDAVTLARPAIRGAAAAARRKTEVRMRRPVEEPAAPAGPVSRVVARVKGRLRLQDDAR
jgi:hypothetical protein